MKSNEELMKEFVDIFRSLKMKLEGVDFKLFQLLEFINIYRTDDVSLFYDYINPNISNLDIFIKKMGLSKPLNKESMFKLYIEIMRIDEELLAFHLTPDVEAKSIFENGMTPLAKKEILDEVHNIALSLNKKTKSSLLPFLSDRDNLGSDYNTYSYTAYLRPEGFSYGFCPEWVRILTDYANVKTKDDIIYFIKNSCKMYGETKENTSKLIDLGLREYEKYLGAKRNIVVFPLRCTGSEIKLLPDFAELIKLNNGDDEIFEFFFDLYLQAHEDMINEKNSQIIPESLLVIIDDETKEIIENKKSTKVLRKGNI